MDHWIQAGVWSGRGWWVVIDDLSTLHTCELLPLGYLIVPPQPFFFFLLNHCCQFQLVAPTLLTLSGDLGFLKDFIY